MIAVMFGSSRQKLENSCSLPCHLKILLIMFLFQGFHDTETLANNPKKSGNDRT